MSTVKFPNVTVRLIGYDSNSFSIIGRVKNALEKGGATREQVKEYCQQSMSGDYDNLLRVAMEWVNVI
jgi:hypothetical protein